MIVIVVVALIVALVGSVIPAQRSPRWLPSAVAAVALAVAGVAAVARSTPVTGVAAVVSVVLCGAVAVVGGTSLVPAVFRLAPRHPAHGNDTADMNDTADTADDPDTVLRGGLVIGALERTAVVASILAGWPEGIAVVLAVKGLARYPELRRAQSSEYFIIGTFTSVLWAAAAGGVGVALLR
ncbi:hypothetical protein [Rhodococcoides corynebacterioides]|uniref:Uncharacterized protein n=1 Tax=Rhodococcoides corynebacterioides TaxID=53972 RepID=A0ABS7P1A2_9NOCA|nr:hypothetical protein [Rhodococcus corynebacterioides]MBY6366168.1 hypothetical protein [Rhodococcus corynebacterioides]MBY6406874.1 hypothetical protein [Rhodococcus corynebacterioides]